MVAQIIRSFHPEYTDYDDGRDGGVLYGFDIYGQYLLGEKKHYMITLGLNILSTHLLQTASRICSTFISVSY